MYLSDILMMNASEQTETTLSIGERISMGLSTALLGMATIFLMLTVLWIMMKLMSVFLAKDNKKAESKAETLPAANTKTVTVPAPAVSDDEEETVAAIVAAISAYTNQSPSSFRVVSFKRIYFN